MQRDLLDIQLTIRELRPMKMPNLQGVGPALAKLQSELEDDAKKFLNDLEGTRARKATVFSSARKQIADAEQSLSAINQFIDDLERATNGGPTLGDSSPSPAPVSAQPSEGAALPQTTSAGA